MKIREKNIVHCSRCVMDNVGNENIHFDKKGICNFCYEYETKSKLRLVDSSKRDVELNDLINKIKLSGKKSDYDCLIGISGGVDSTYTAHLVKKIGLRPLALHFDNGWNSELAVHNIEKTLKMLDIDLTTYVIDWEEFKSLQLSFLKSSTPDGEIPTDHAILSILYKVANQYDIKYIISGNNFKNEGVMPENWAYGHIDWRYIKGVHQKFGNKNLRTYPFLTLKKFIWYTFIKKIKIISILNYIDYQKDEAMQVLENELDWKYYGGKHYESNYTKFFQGVILPQKFKIDKRKLHLSALILSDQISREEALEVLSSPIYPENQLDGDTEYFKKKLELSDDEYDKIITDSPKSFKDYKNSYVFHKKLRILLSYLRSKKMYFN